LARHRAARFDAPSVFGSLLDRQAGSFRLAPYGLTVPTARHYEPGTNVLATTWHAPGGWVVVRDALTMGPRRGVDTITPHTRPPADEDADHALVRVVTCEVELVCEPVFDYGRVTADWRVADDALATADAVGGDVCLRLQTDMALGVEGGCVRARHALRAGERLFCSLSWAEMPAPPADAWMRDSTFTLRALHWLNLDWEADEFMQYVADLEANDDGALQIMYGIDGRRDLSESTLDDLSGYDGARPVRIGNGAFDQRQNDVYGAVLDSILLHTRRSQRLPRRLWPVVEPRPSAPAGSGGSPTRGSGRHAASRGTTSPRS
jgi:GH15 family glucan-1,4-alpha-glucosidase